MLAGDFNLYPDSAVYRLLDSGHLNLMFEDPTLTLSG